MYKKIICVLLAAIVLIAVAVGAFATDPVSIERTRAYGEGTTRFQNFDYNSSYDMTLTIQNNTGDSANYALVATTYDDAVCTDVSVGNPVMIESGDTGDVVANITTGNADTDIKCIVVKVDNGKLYPVNRTVSVFNDSTFRNWR